MTSELEKLYENAGVKPLPTCNNCSMLDEYWSNGTYCSTCKYDKDKDECNMANYLYPPFTSEKQLELIKILIKDYYYYLDAIDVNKFENSLAKLINDLWQNLPEDEKQQIRGILK